MRPLVALFAVAACSSSSSKGGPDLSTGMPMLDGAIGELGTDLGGDLAMTLPDDLAPNGSDMTATDAGTVIVPPPPINFDGEVDAIANAGDSWYYGGKFGRTQVIPASGLLVLDGNDNLPSPCSLGPGVMSGTVYAVLQVGASIYIGGDFTLYQNKSAINIAKLDATTCALDTNFSPQSQPNGFSDAVFALASDGTWLYVGGRFTDYRGVSNSANHVARLSSSDGTLDPFFGSAGVGSNGFNDSVNALAVVGTSLFAGGDFSSYVADPASHLAKIDLTNGKLDTNFSPPGGNGFNNRVFALASDLPPSPTPTPTPGPFLYVGGQFNQYRGTQTAQRVARIGMDGTLDTTFTGSSGFDDAVRALAVSGSSLYAGGDFTTYRTTQSANSIAKLNLVSGNLDVGFSPSLANGFDASVAALAVSGSSLYAGGDFTAYRGTAGAVQRLARLDLSNGALLSALVPTGATAKGVNGSVWALGAGSGGVFVGGAFTAYGGQPANNLAKFDGAGFLDVSFTGGASGGFDDRVLALAATSSAVYAGGDFTAYRGVANSANHLAKLSSTDGTRDTNFSPAGATTNGFNNSVTALAIYGSSLLVGGYFTDYKGVASSANRFARLALTDGTLDTTFPAGATSNGFDSEVLALAIAPSPSPAVVVGGFFSNSYFGSTVGVKYIAKLDASTSAVDATFSPATNGFDAPVFALAVSDNDIYVGGTFSSYRNVANAAHYLAKLNAASGVLDDNFTPLGPTNGFDGAVLSIAVLGGSVYVGGGFTAYRNVTGSAWCIAKLAPSDGRLDPTFSPQALNGLQGYCQVNAVVPAGALLELGGDFLSYRDLAAWYRVRVDASGVMQ